VELLENLRFDPGEEANDPRLVDRLVAGQDAYVNDAFGVCHRAHASVVGPPERLPSAAGRLVEAEVRALSPLLDQPPRPYVAVLGGAKVADKLGLIRSLVDRAEVVLVGGAMSFTFLAALGHEVGDSLVEPEHLEACRVLLDRARTLMVPTDVVAVRSADPSEVCEVGRTIPPGFSGVDIGHRTAAEYAEEISGAGTVFWNGPMGMFEDARFAAGTQAVARAVASCGGYTVVGGGDSVAALNALGLAEYIDHVSTGGGAALEFIELGDLPGLAALRASLQRVQGHG
jgi:phosphoglycerate kinase